MGQYGLFTAEQLAAKAGLAVSTINDYARLGLLRPIKTGEGELFASGDFTRLEVIAKGRCLGFTLSELRILIESAAKRD